MTEVEAKRRRDAVAAANAKANAVRYDRGFLVSSWDTSRNNPWGVAALGLTAGPIFLRALNGLRKGVMAPFRNAGRVRQFRRAAADKAVAADVDAAKKYVVPPKPGKDPKTAMTRAGLKKQTTAAFDKAEKDMEAAAKTIEKNEAVLKGANLTAEAAKTANAEIVKAREALTAANSVKSTIDRAREADRLARKTGGTFEDAYAKVATEHLSEVKAQAKFDALKDMTANPANYYPVPLVEPSLPTKPATRGFGGDIVSLVFGRGAPMNPKGANGPGLFRSRAYDANAVESRAGLGPLLRKATESADNVTGEVVGRVLTAFSGKPNIMGSPVPARSTGSAWGDWFYGLTAPAAAVGYGVSAYQARDRADAKNRKTIAEAAAARPTPKPVRQTDAESWRVAYDGNMKKIRELEGRVVAGLAAPGETNEYVEVLKTGRNLLKSEYGLATIEELSNKAQSDYAKAEEAAFALSLTRGGQHGRSKAGSPDSIDVSAYNGPNASPENRAKWREFGVRYGADHRFMTYNDIERAALGFYDDRLRSVGVAVPEDGQEGEANAGE